MIAQPPLHLGALHALAAPVNQPDLAEPRVARRVQVLINDRHDVARRETVEIDGVFDRDVDRRFVFHC